MKEAKRYPGWMGSPKSGGFLPMGCKDKKEAGMEGAGQVSNYPDTFEAVQSVQKREVAKLKANKLAAGQRD